MQTPTAHIAQESAPEAAAPIALSISQQIAEFAANLTPDAVPAAVRENAKLHVLDVVGTARDVKEVLGVFE